MQEQFVCKILFFVPGICADGIVPCVAHLCLGNLAGQAKALYRAIFLYFKFGYFRTFSNKFFLFIYNEVTENRGKDHQTPTNLNGKHSIVIQQVFHDPTKE
jgi:hypothetical protein